jgi:zona occludens toxin
MIELVTGLPGNCKTLHTISRVRDWAVKDSRQVFYSGIPLSEEGKEKLGWLEIDPLKWFEAPPNSIVIIDECQRVFRNRSLGQIPGKHVTELETHRHLGVDLVFITQHPSLVDPAIRKLTGAHRHMVRIWGMEASTVHYWPAVRDNCDKPAQRNDSEKTKWKFDKSVYSLYKSAEVHTVKRTIPKGVFMLLLVPVALAGAGFMVYKTTIGKHPQAATAKPGQVATGSVQGGLAPAGAPARLDPLAEAKDYAWKQTPRVEGLAYTAPKYDGITVPTAVPVPAACVVMKNRCQCYSQQATKLDVGFNQCAEIARNGYFQDFDPNGAKGDRDRQLVAQAHLEQVDRLPISGASTRDVGPSASLRGSDGFGVNGKAGPGVRVPAVDAAPLQAEPSGSDSRPATNPTIRQNLRNNGLGVS